MAGHLVSRIWQSDPTIHAPAAHRRACSYDAFIPDELASLALRLDATLAGLISEAERAIKELNNEGDAALAPLVPLARLLLRTESIASSKVEGMQLSARELARAEARAESGLQPGQTAIEVLANIDAMALAVDDAAEEETFGISEIKAIHRRLMERSAQKSHAGLLRTDQNWVGGNDFTPCGADFVPPPPEELDRLLDDLCRAINDDMLSPLVQAALVHAQFETIHPFADGNGRTGRALVHVVLKRRKLAPRFVPPISVIFAEAKHRYISGLTRFRSADGEAGIAEWLTQFSTAIYRAALLALAYVDEVNALKEKWRQDLETIQRVPRADATAWSIIDLLPAHPMISAPVATALTGRAKGRVYEAVEQLVNAGVLIPLSQGRRNRWWEAEGMLQLITRLEGGEFPPTM